MCPHQPKLKKGPKRRKSKSSQKHLRRLNPDSSIFDEIANDRGKGNEFFVEFVLQELQAENKISGFIHHQAFSREDRRGIDFTIVKNNGEKLGVQVKSSVGALEKFRENAPEKQRKRLAAIVIKSRRDAKLARQGLLKILDGSNDVVVSDDKISNIKD